MPSTLPPFPNDVPTHPLLVIDYALIERRDPAEINKLWTAATDLGFWYLKNHGTDSLVEDMFIVGDETMNLPLDEKMQFEMGDDGNTFGYKAKGSTVTNEQGTPDRAEFITISKDDAFAWPAMAHRFYPSTVNKHMKASVVPFIKASAKINATILDVLNDRLGLPSGTLAALHSDSEYSGSEARLIKTWPKPENVALSAAALPAHTDFGSLSFLHNRLGGLQVLPPGHTEWLYVKPMPGHAICNLGDAMKIFSNGILESNIHRVVSPPGDQAKFIRWSLVYFSRPGNSIILAPLHDKSEMIKKAVESGKNLATTSTAGEWFERRVKYLRVKNMTSKDKWQAGRGTEHTDGKVELMAKAS